jgi:orotate phosphoribosyltransferase
LRLLCRVSLRTGDVVLTSGRVSDFYVDCKQLVLHPEGCVLVGQVLWDRAQARGLSFDAVGGPALGAVPLTTSFCCASHAAGRPIPGFIIRSEPKRHGTSAWLEGRANLAAGSRLLVCEDVITTGGSTLRAVSRIRDEGFEVAGVLVVVDREEGGRQALVDAGLTVDSVFGRRELLAGALPPTTAHGAGQEEGRGG